MQDHNRPIAGATKLLPFLRSAIASPPPSLPLVPPMQPMASRLARPLLVPKTAKMRKPVSLPTLSAAAALAHDARNALTSLTLLSGLLAEPGVLNAGHTQYAVDLQAVTCILTGLVSRFAVAVHEISADLPPQSDAADRAQSIQPAADRKKRSNSAGEALQSCAHLLRAIAGSSIEVHVSSENALPPTVLEDDALARVLMNMVKNASEAMPGGGTVHITARRALSRTAPAVLVHVSDNGPGIPAHALDQIFQPGFSSKRTSSNAAEPCGLGLAIVRELVESTGGQVRVASTRRRGTTFELTLPCLKPEQGDEIALP